MTTPSQRDTPSRHDRDPSRDKTPGDVSRDFWGDAENWPSEPHDRREPRPRLGATVSRWWNSTGSLPVTRTHGTPTRQQPVIGADDTDRLLTDGWPSDTWPSDRRSAEPRAAEPSTAESEADDWSGDHEIMDDSEIMDDWSVDDWSTDDGRGRDQTDEDAIVAPGPQRPGVDPLLARLGGLAIVLTLLVPLVMGFTSVDDDGEALRTSTSAAAALPATAPTLPTAATAGTAAAPPTATEAPASPAPTAAPTADTSPASVTEPVVTDPAVPEPAVPESAIETQPLAIDTCALEYEVAAGDFWIRIADGSGVALADVLAANSATVATPLFPGRTICLPEGATTPPPPPSPTTVAAPTTTRPSTTSSRPATTVPPTTRPPAPSTTTAPAPRPPASTASAADVQAIIRAVWPDDLEERALQVAWRESNFIPTAKNFCCYGVFQIYWSVHRGWLAGIGITSAEQLYDPTLNARAALALYERSGGWGPWGG